MLYRLRPDAPLEWADFPGFATFKKAVEQGVDFDRLDWLRTEERVFSSDLLRIALRHGVATSSGIVLAHEHTADLGRSDTLRAYQQQSQDAQADLRAQDGALMEALIPGWTKHGEELDERIRESVESVAQEAGEDLAEVMAAPVKPELIAHWMRLDGDVPTDCLTP